MKKLFDKPLHVITVIILVAVGALYWYAHTQQQRYDGAASAYLREALTDIASWEPAALRRQLAPEALAAIDDTHMQALVERYRPLGAFAEVKELQFGTLTAALSLFSGHTLLSYSGQVRFANGTAHFTATLVLRDERFRLYNINFGEPQPGAAQTAPAAAAPAESTAQ
jgi:hypothetical protein